MRIETVYTKTHKQLKIIIFDESYCIRYLFKKSKWKIFLLCTELTEIIYAYVGMF
jgi:hypothetical protein